MIESSKKLILAGAILALSACSSLNEVDDASVGEADEMLKIPDSYLKSAMIDSANEDGAALAELKSKPSVSAGDAVKNAGSVGRVESLTWEVRAPKEKESPYGSLPLDMQLKVSAEAMPMKDFIHYVFGQLFSVNYILGASIESNGDAINERVTISLQKSLAPRELFDLTVGLLNERGVNYKFEDGTFFIFRGEDSDNGPQMVIGLGRDEATVPKTNQQIMQVIPLKFGIKVAMERTLRSLVKAKITPDFSQGAIFAEGSREQILKVIELIDLLDTPANTGRYVGLLDLLYILPDDFARQVKILLQNEGIGASINSAQNANLVLVPLKQLGAVAIFASNEFLLNRASYWAKMIDVPATGDVKQYFIYKPRYSSVSDLYESFEDLVDTASDNSSGKSGSTTGVAPSSKRSNTVGLSDVKMLIDSRSNSLIFYASGVNYRALMPLLKRLDVMPKQVMLDILIAEVSLKDEFKYGVEWAVQRGEVNLTTQGAFGATSVGGIGLIINGTEGPLQANFLQTNNLVNVLSNPSLMVRDGTSAAINIGSSISIVGSTTQDPINGDRQTTESEYRKTGVNVSVEVSVNAAGIVVMKVDQMISNSVPGSAGAGGNPDIFERSIRTEILAQSGQTVMLGGLISETGSSGSSGTPFMSKIPLLGGLFKTDARSSDRTELIMLVTPRVIEDLTEWDSVLENFSEALRHLEH